MKTVLILLIGVGLGLTAASVFVTADAGPIREVPGGVASQTIACPPGGSVTISPRN